MQREASAPQVQQLELSRHSGSSSSTVGSEHWTAAAAQQGVAGPVAALLQRDSSGSLSGEGQPWFLWRWLACICTCHAQQYNTGQCVLLQRACCKGGGADAAPACLPPSPRLPHQAALQAVQQPTAQEPLRLAHQGAAAAAREVSLPMVAPGRWQRQRGSQPTQQRGAPCRRQVGERLAGCGWCVAFTFLQWHLGGTVQAAVSYAPGLTSTHFVATSALPPCSRRPAPACRRSCCPAWPLPRRWARPRPPRCSPSQWSPPWTQMTVLVSPAGPWP